jgi:hypothetical protein
MTRHSATGRADLLRALAQGVEAPLALDAGESGWFGYRQRPKRVAPKPAAELHAQAVVQATATAAPEVAGPDRRQPLQMESIWAVVGRSSVSTEATDEAPGELAVQPITEEEARGLDRIVDYEDLIPWARLTPVLRRRLSQPRRGGIDLKRLCRQVAAQRPLKQLPRQVLSRWHPDIVVALDFSPRLWPYRWDMHRLCEQLRRHCGRTGLSLRLLAHGPWGGWTEWLTDEEADEADSIEPQVWTQPPAGARLLVVGDLGALSPDTSLRDQWRDWVQQAQAAGLRVEALLPLGADHLPAELAGLLPVIRWSPDSHLRPESGSQRAGAESADDGGEEVNDSLHDLLAQVASLRRVDPPLLRALRRALPHQHGNAGLEGAVWNHLDVEAGLACAIEPAKAQPWLERYAALPAATRQVLQPLRRAHHRHLRAALRDEELLLQAGNGAEELLEPHELSVALDRLDRMSRWAVGQPADQVPAGWQGFAEEAVRRVDAKTAERFPAFFTRLLAVDIRARQGLSPNGDALPLWANAGQLGFLLALSGTGKRDHWIVEDIPSRQILLQSRPPTIGQRALGAHFEADRVVVTHVQTDRAMVHTTRAGPAVLCDSASAEALDLRAEALRLQLAPVRRPFGIEGWDLRFGQQGSVPRVRIPHLRKGEDELPDQWLYSPPSEVDPDRRYHLIQGPFEDLRDGPPGEVGYSIDEFGVYVDLAINGVTQRLRHLPPGRFLMGSPANEPGRFDDEGPQHEVTLTRGFWLADTCCTQALWRAVMGGKNPSHFTGDPTLPVDSVSWDDVQTFLGRLQEQLPPGVEAVLPTEAQWEYACRADTQTPYSVGDTLTPEQANFGGNLGKTVPVKSLPVNPWGLYEMHGNLWEWCADAQRSYSSEPLEDPDGGQGGVFRVLRGGAWIGGATHARSAHRRVYHRDIRLQCIGFRFALRSIEPSAGGGTGTGRAEPARVLPQAEPGAGVGPAEPGPRAEGLGARVAAAVGRFFKPTK